MADKSKGPAATKEQVQRELVPLALETYRTLLTSEDKKIRKETADTIMEIIGLLGRQKVIHTGRPSVSFTLPTSDVKKALIGVETHARREITAKVESSEPSTGDQPE